MESVTAILGGPGGKKTPEENHTVLVIYVSFKFQMKFSSIVFAINLCLMAAFTIALANQCTSECNSAAQQCQDSCGDWDECTDCTNEADNCRNNCRKRSLHFKLWPSRDDIVIQ